MFCLFPELNSDHEDTWRLHEKVDSKRQHSPTNCFLEIRNVAVARNSCQQVAIEEVDAATEQAAAAFARAMSDLAVDPETHPAVVGVVDVVAD